MKEITLVMNMESTVIIQLEDESMLASVEELEAKLRDALLADHLKITNRKIFIRDL